MAFFLPNLKQRGYLDRIQTTICNVGSRKLTSEDDYASQGWQFFAPNLTIFGFDADPEACEAANAEFEAKQANWNEFHLPLAIAKEVGVSPLYVTHHPMCSSLYPPNEAFLKRFFRLPALMNLSHTVSVETTNLDTFCQAEQIDEIDFLQIDVQGADLQVLEGATNLLSKSVLAIKIEVEFSPLYIGSPLFSDIDSHLRKQGFTLFDLSVARELRSSLYSPNRPGQLLWGDAIYVRDLLQEENLAFQTPEHLFKLACVADVLEFVDYAFELLKYLTLIYGSNPDYNFAETIAASLSQIPELAKVDTTSPEMPTDLKSYLKN